MFVWIFITLLPFSLIELLAQKEIALMVIPFSVVIAGVFAVMDKTGALNENPFENQITDVPLSALCNTIERDLKEQLDETSLPPKFVPEKGYLF